MSKPFIVLVLVLLANHALCQQSGYLVLIDAENHQPFQVRIGDTSTVSSSLGHAIIPHLKDSSYQLYIQFYDHTVREQAFRISINNRDQGYQLKRQDNGKWTMYNWLSHEMRNALTGVDSSRLIDQGVKRDDAFSRLMASVVNDSSVMYNTYKGSGLSGDTAKRAPVAFARKSDSVQAGTGADAASLAMVRKVKPAAGTNFKPSIKKLREISLKISRKLVFLDILSKGVADTVTLFIFFDLPDSSRTKQPEKDSAQVKKAIQVIPKDTVALRKDSSARLATGHCSLRAAAADLDSVRSAILIPNAEADKVAAAAKAFQSKCFSSLQLRVLAGLFVSDRGKYRLIEAAYPHIWDSEHVRDLQDMFSEKQYVRKFHTLAAGK